MQKRFSLLICGFLLAASLFFMACPTDPETMEPTYSVITETYLRSALNDAEPNPDVGIITSTSNSGPTGTEVNVVITSGERYYLDEVFQDEISKGVVNPFKVILLDKDITVKAYFKELPADNYKVILKQPESGTISFSIAGVNGNKEYGTTGSRVTLSNAPADGYAFKEYTLEGVEEGLDLGNSRLSFTLPAKNVTVSGVFEKLADKDIDGLITAGKDALKSGNLAAAVNAYEEAYKKDPDNTEALVYSTIAKLASIAWSGDVGNFFKNRLGLKYYPNTLDALIDPQSWFEYYPDIDYGSYQPPLNVPGWLTEKGAYKDTLVTIDGKSVAGSATWSLILIANLIDRNTTGLNDALDDVIDAVFNNPNYTEAENRTAKLKGKDPVEIDEEIVQILGLSEFPGDGGKVYVGWAKLELLFSALKAVKGTLLYVDSYNWDYDIGFVKNLPWDESVLEQIDILAGNRNKVLPLRTGFMTARGGSYLEDSRTAYVEALESIADVYDYYTGSTGKIPDRIKPGPGELAEYKQIVTEAKDAVKNGKTFTVPAEALGGQELTIDFGKFFTPGQLALANLIETENTTDGKAPVFYGYTQNFDGTPGSLTKINSAEDLGKYSGFALKFKAGPIGEIVGNDFAGYLLRELGFVEFLEEDAVIALDSMSGMIAWAVYHWNDGGKEFFHSQQTAGFR